MHPLIAASRELSASLRGLKFSDPVTHVYNPLDYAGAPHEEYLKRYGHGSKRVLFLGMNPGPFGMAQTGVPFGEVAAVAHWLKIEGKVGKPDPEHPKRPILGFGCPHSEVSGRRLWGLFAQRFGSAGEFFAGHFVANYCPLVFMESSGKNRTPDKLTSGEMRRVYAACDLHLKRVIEALQPRWLVGVGGFAEARCTAVLPEFPGVTLARILHPSPASPAANRDWAGEATRQLVAAGIW